jgi:hypothetical protein
VEADDAAPSPEKALPRPRPGGGAAPRGGERGAGPLSPSSLGRGLVQRCKADQLTSLHCSGLPRQVEEPREREDAMLID